MVLPWAPSISFSPHASVLWLPRDGLLEGHGSHKGFLEMAPSAMRSQGRLSFCSAGRVSVSVTISAHCSSPVSCQIYSQYSSKQCSLNHSPISCGPPATIIKKDLSQFKIRYNNHKAFQQQL